jgi:hypothetical protein
MPLTAKAGVLLIVLRSATRSAMRTVLTDKRDIITDLRYERNCVRVQYYHVRI